MTENKDYGICYVEGEGGCLYPDLHLEQKTHYDIGKYGLIIGEYTLVHNRHDYISMLNDGTWNQYLNDLDVKCQQMEEELVKEMMKKEGVTEELKMMGQMEWIRRVNLIRVGVEREVVEIAVLFSEHIEEILTILDTFN